jgi:tRNA(Ile2) C34 agmatinyltransferase TiaS
MTNGFTISNNGQASPPTTDCTNGTNTFNVTNVTLTDLKSTVGGVVNLSYIEEVDIGASTKCTFTGKEVEGTYANGGSVVTFTGGTGITGSPAACGTTKLDGAFTLEGISGKKYKGVF